MRHTILALVCTAASTVASAAFWPFSAFDDDAAATSVQQSVTSNGVTKTRLGSLYRDNLVVTDVDLSLAQGGITNLVAGSNIVIEEPAPGTKRISAVGGGGGGIDADGVNLLIGLYDQTNLTGRIGERRTLDDMSVWLKTNDAGRTVFVDTGDRLATTGQVNEVARSLYAHEAYADASFENHAGRIDGISRQQGDLNNRVIYGIEPAVWSVSNRVTYCERSVSNLVYYIGAQMPRDKCLEYAALGIPALKCTLPAGNTAMFVLCEDGTYRDASTIELPFVPGYPVGPVTDMLGWTFTQADLYRTFGPDILWTADFTPTKDNLSKKVSEVCGGAGYPQYYGRESTAFELLCDILATDRKAVLRGDPYLVYQTNFVKFANLRAVSEQLYGYAADAHSEIIRVRSKVDGIRAPDYSPENEELVDTIAGVYRSKIDIDLDTFLNEVVYPSDDLSVEWANEYTDEQVAKLSGEVDAKLGRKQDRLPYPTNAIPAAALREADPTVGLTNATVYASGTNFTFLTEHQSLADYRRKDEKVSWEDVTNAPPFRRADEKVDWEDVTNHADFVTADVTNGIPEAIVAATNGIPEAIVAATNGIPEAVVAATNGIPGDISCATNGVWTGLLDLGVIPYVRAVSLGLTAAQETAGVTFEHGGTNWNSAVEVGRGAKAAADVSGVTGPANLRNVGVAVGFAASVDVPGEPSRSQGVAVGPTARSSGYSSVAIGGGVRHFDDEDEDDMTGDNAYVSGDYSTAIGYGAKVVGNCGSALGNKAKAFGQGAVALGCSAVASNDYAVQVGPGVNVQAHSLKFEDTTIVSNGNLTAYTKAETDSMLSEKADATATAAAISSLSDSVSGLRSSKVAYADVATEWVAGAAYEKGQVVYVKVCVTDQKHLFVCVQAHEEPEVTLGDEDYWCPFDEYRFAAQGDLPTKGSQTGWVENADNALRANDANNAARATAAESAYDGGTIVSWEDLVRYNETDPNVPAWAKKETVQELSSDQTFSNAVNAAVSVDHSTNNTELVDTVKTVAGGHTLFVYASLGEVIVTAVKTDGSVVSRSAGGSGFYEENVVSCEIVHPGTNSLVFLRVNGGDNDSSATWYITPDGLLVGAYLSGGASLRTTLATRRAAFTLTADMAFNIDFD